MRIDEFQRLIEATYFEKDSARGLAGTFMWFTEEVGELSRALRDDNKAAMEEEFADVLAWLFTLASMSGIEMDRVVSKYTRGCPVCTHIPCACAEKV
jgi:NTP pyrophosphatase (non-canonical NTP hydrolase)